jgi:hypothetical protein
MENGAKRLCRYAFLVAIFLLLPISTWGKSINPDIRPGEGVTEQRKLSDYFSPLAGTNLDTPVFILDSGKPGATVLLLGGTHGNELAGSVSGLVMVENTVMKAGKLLVIPYANHSAISMQDSRNNIAHRHLVRSRSGERYLLYGDRRTDPDDQQKEDPEVYKNPMGYELKNGAESRNLNRTYPGNAEGTPTEQLSYAIIALIKQERVDLSLDMHEADTPERKVQDDGDYRPGGNKRLAYTLVSHPYRGLSHLEIGNATDSLSFLSESPNPGQDGWRSDGDVISDPKYPLTHRVGLHLRLFKNLADAYAEESGEAFVIEGLPEYQDLLAGDIGQFLN